MVVIQYVVLEEPSVKLSRLLIFDCAGIERISVLRSNLGLLWYLIGRADLALVATTFVRVHSHSALLCKTVDF